MRAPCLWRRWQERQSWVTSCCLSGYRVTNLVFGDFLQQFAETYFLAYQRFQVGNGYTCLLHAVAVAQCYGVVFECLVVYRDAIGSTYGILAAITLAYRVFLVILAALVVAQHTDDFFGLFGQSVFAYKGQYSRFYGRKGCRQT